MPSQLDALRLRSAIDCDTLDVTAAQALGPFVDCTSNQAIVHAELSKRENAGVISAARAVAAGRGDDTPRMVARVAACLLSARMLPHLAGFVHTQTNPAFARDTAATVAEARDIVAIYGTLRVPSERVCIKIPATREGLQACRVLELDGIHTLATMVFTMAQAKEAGRAGCTYVAPYINDLRVHFEPGYRADRNDQVAVAAQTWFERSGCKTQVLAASFVAKWEVVRLAGLRHITVSAPLLAELSAAPAEGGEPSLVDMQAHSAVDEEGDQDLWRVEMSSGRGEHKLVDAINIFAGMQEKLEQLCAV